jgi:DNA polymerase-3 subunit epsilon
MRQVVLDTETTGMPVERGHRIIEIGAVEIINRRLTGRTFHHYIHPEREIDEGAQAVHGISLEFLEGKPRFAGIADELIEFLRGAELIAHNAAFDVGFLNAARERYPGQRNSLDALCKRLGVDNGHRNLHGALLDAELLADVYLAMTSGQTDLGLAVVAESAAAASARRVSFDPGQLRVVAASEDDLQTHRAWIDKLKGASGGRSLWPEAAEA